MHAVHMLVCGKFKIFEDWQKTICGKVVQAVLPATEQKDHRMLKDKKLISWLGTPLSVVSTHQSLSFAFVLLRTQGTRQRANCCRTHGTKGDTASKWQLTIVLLALCINFSQVFVKNFWPRWKEKSRRPAPSVTAITSRGGFLARKTLRKAAMVKKEKPSKLGALSPILSKNTGYNV